MQPDDLPFTGLDAMLEDLKVPDFKEWSDLSQSYRYEFSKDRDGNVTAEPKGSNE